MLAELYRGRHLRRLDFMRLQGATLADSSVQYYRTGLIETAHFHTNNTFILSVF